MKAGIDRIEELQDLGEVWVIDYLPRRMKGKDFFELEEVLRDRYLEEFSDKIVRILLKLLCYLPCEVYLTELPRDYEGALKEIPAETDLRSMPLAALADLIALVIREDVSSVQILAGECPCFNLSVNGEFSVDLHGLARDMEEWDLVDALVRQEGLFLRKL
ncbi:MAG: hypothetical protein IIU47_08470 [Lachnospiraceae bacterium]|nr:hypothetical protein [Lachnospiraceae bacterium]